MAARKLTMTALIDPLTALDRTDSIPALLDLACEMTGLRIVIAAVAEAAVSGESFASVPILLRAGTHIADLRALAPPEGQSVEPRIVSVLTRFASLIAAQVDRQLLLEQEHGALLDERAAGELREQFVAILGHDLRNPLQAVYACGDLLESKLSDPALSNTAARIKITARRMSAMIDDVLDLARSRLGGGIGIELEDVDDIDASLMGVVQEFKEAQPDVRILAESRVACPLRCDLGRVLQVASNLLANALTHGETGSGVTFRASTDAGDLVLEVWNAGNPISPANLGKIFEPFWRNSVSPSRNGLGLGLHICAQIVRAHGGRISVTSSLAGGTRFTARLPLGAVAAGASESQERRSA